MDGGAPELPQGGFRFLVRYLYKLIGSLTIDLGLVISGEHVRLKSTAKFFIHSLVITSDICFSGKIYYKC